MPRLFIPLHIRFELSECMEYDPMALRRRTMSLLPSHVITTREGDTVHAFVGDNGGIYRTCSCLLYTSPSPRDVEESRMPSSA